MRCLCGVWDAFMYLIHGTMSWTDFDELEA
jgi:hypothetical protein